MSDTTGNEETQLDRIEQMVKDLHQLVIGAIGNIQDAQVNGTGMQRMVANQLPDFSQLNIPAPREY